MTESEQSDNPNVQPRAIIDESSVTIEARLSTDEDGPVGIWLKPSQLDSDGEFYLSLKNIAPALKILSVNAADIWTG